MWCKCVNDLQGVLLARKVLRQSGHGMSAAIGRVLLARAFPASASCTVAVAASQCYKACLNNGWWFGVPNFEPTIPKALHSKTIQSKLTRCRLLGSFINVPLQQNNRNV